MRGSATRERIRGVAYWRGLIATAIFVVLSLFATMAWRDYNDIMNNAVREVERAADGAREHVLTVVQTGVLISTVLDERLKSMNWEEIAASRSVHEYLEKIDDTYPQIVAVSLADSTGRLRSSSRVLPAPTPTMSADPESYFEVCAGDPQILIGRAVTDGVVADPHFDLIFRRTAAEGHVDGTIVVSIPSKYFKEIWRATLPDTLTGVVRGDMKVLVREPEDLAEQQLRPTGAVLAAITRTGNGTFRTVSSLDGVERMFAFRRVDPFNLYVVNGVDVTRLLHRWYRNLLLSGGYWCLAMLALAAVARVSIRGLRQEHAAAIRLYEESERRGAIEQQLHQAEKMEALGQVTGGFAHDFGNIFTAISLNLELLRGRLGNDEFEGRLRDAISEAELGSESVQSLLVFARAAPLKMGMVDINVVMLHVETLLHQAIGSQSYLRFAVVPEAWPVETDSSQLELALLNLAINARDAMLNGGSLRVEVTNLHLEGTPNGLVGDFVSLSVTDTGIGMRPEVLARATEPFFTTKEAGKGTGLGLSQVYGFARQCGGTITIESAEGRGTTVTMYLRRAARRSDQDRTVLRSTVDVTEPNRSWGSAA